MVRASSFSARRWAAVAPTLPAPTTVILSSMQCSRGGSSPSPGVHLAVRVGAQRLDRIQRAALAHAQALLGPAVCAGAPRRGDERGERFVRRAAAQALPQIDPPRSVQAEEPGAVRLYAARGIDLRERLRCGATD